MSYNHFFSYNKIFSNFVYKISVKLKNIGHSTFEVAMSGIGHVSVIGAPSSIRNFFKFGFNLEPDKCISKF